MVKYFIFNKWWFIKIFLHFSACIVCIMHTVLYKHNNVLPTKKTAAVLSRVSLNII